MYHSALSKGQVIEAESLECWTNGKSEAFRGSVCDESTIIRHIGVDLIYCEPSWRHGMKVFAARSNTNVINHLEYLVAIRSLIQEHDGPAIVLAGSYMRKALKPEFERPIGLEGGIAMAFSWRIELPSGVATNLDCLRWLATQFESVGDPCCGYGNAARAFHSVGKRFVASDINGSCIRVLVDSLNGT